ncbi:DUF475 domain-containing protein [Thioclava kandeliae]|uniref:DUF475 domain-containing protein n=1 Tax=Thioclava kandeliae TaxID=3070818 RepID=A0ABV1SKN5_9RHOB
MTLLGLCASFWLGWRFGGTFAAGSSFLLICAVLAVLEISLSFDNTIVNANKLKTMALCWQKRFLTWGILIAVFGMRIVFPLAIVAIAAHIGPVEAIRFAATQPQDYAPIMRESHLGISAFGGAFLRMVALSFFLDEDKEIDWISRIESRMRAVGSITGVGYRLVLALVLIVGMQLGTTDRATFFMATILGRVVFMGVEALAHLLDGRRAVKDAARAGGFGAFLYLEVLDASFSFDGVIGAFYSILALSVVMFAQSLVHVPEVVTGLIGAGIIALSLVSSLRFNRLAI